MDKQIKSSTGLSLGYVHEHVHVKTFFSALKPAIWDLTLPITTHYIRRRPEYNFIKVVQPYGRS